MYLCFSVLEYKWFWYLVLKLAITLHVYYDKHDNTVAVCCACLHVVICSKLNLLFHLQTKFFNGIKPEKALEDDKEFQNAICTLQDCVLLHPSKARTDVRPLDCCIFSYSTPFGTNFQLFDTILAWITNI